jgi:diaminopimelate decarboxylase
MYISNHYSEKKATLADWPKRINIKNLHQRFGAPAWLVSETQLLENLAIFMKFTDCSERILFPVKTNPSLSILRILAQNGAGADCANHIEVDLALFAGFSYRNISYNSPVQDLLLIKSLLRKGASVVMDDKQSILALQNEIGDEVFEGKLFLRVNLSTDINYAKSENNQELMSHAHKSSKFGIPSEDILAFTTELSIAVSGLHVHVGTQMDNIESFIDAINEMHALADMLKAAGLPIKHINLGGGLGIPFTHEHDFPALQYWVNTMNERKNELYDYYLEPGHALVGNAVALLAEVQSIKPSRGKNWAILNVGTDQLAKITLLHWEHRILCSQGTEFIKGNDAIAGPLCFAGDTLLDQISIGHLKINDPVLICEAGAYTFSLSNKFNGRLAPLWVILKADGNAVCVMNEEGVYDNNQYAYFEWNDLNPIADSLSISPEKIRTLSSNYLNEGISDDRFEYLNMTQIAHNQFSFKIDVYSGVNFISMPFAIRIFGDASIVALLYWMGCSKKEIAVWGRKLTLDCFDIIPINNSVDFTISLSELRDGSSKTIISRFKTSCKRCSGSFILKFDL